MVIKRGLFVCLFLCVVFLVPNVTSSSYGVSPAIYDVDFEPGLEREFNFKFYRDDPSVNLEIYSREELTEFVEFTPAVLENGEQDVVVMLRLPQELDRPGAHRLLIGARPVISPGEGGVGIVASVNGVINVRVPYPGQYAETRLTVDNANVNEEIRYKLVIFSRGSESITASAEIEVFDLDGEIIKKFSVGTFDIAGVSSREIRAKLDPSGIVAGNYKAKATVVYQGGPSATSEIPFRIGELNVDIVNYTNKVEKGSINPFYVDIKSGWNNKIENVYVEVSSEDSDVSLVTPSVSLKPWDTTRMNGYLDLKGLKAEEDTVKLNVVVHYGDRTTEESIEVILEDSKFNINFTLITIVAGIIAVLSFFAWVVIKIKKMEKKSGKKK
ncbi:MAG: hypothetical protein KC506_00430 [Nanoarchaeota archaeon]|nr:hypothetical protein [Nanoarchaeota archaeon]